MDKYVVMSSYHWLQDELDIFKTFGVGDWWFKITPVYQIFKVNKII